MAYIDFNIIKFIVIMEFIRWRGNRRLNLYYFPIPIPPKVWKGPFQPFSGISALVSLKSAATSHGSNGRRGRGFLRCSKGNCEARRQLILWFSLAFLAL
jgi:hypothetical protein